MSQPELSFDAPTPQNGYDRWQAERRAAKVELGKRLGLPLGHAVEIWLRGNVRLRGRLELAEERLFLPEGDETHLHLTIGRTVFAAGEIDSCVRMD